MVNSITQDQEINVLLVDDEKDSLEQSKLFLEKENKSNNIKTTTTPKKKP